MTTAPDVGVKRTSVLHPGFAPDASRTTVPSSSGEPTATVQPWAINDTSMILRASATLRLVANDPLVGPAPVSAGSSPGSFGKLGGSASKILPNAVFVVVGRPMLAATAVLAAPPGTAVGLERELGICPADFDAVAV